MSRTRTAGAVVTGLVAAAGVAAAAPARAEETLAQWSVGEGRVHYSATYLGSVDGLQGNNHHVLIDSKEQTGHIVSEFCDRDGDCVQRSDRRISSRSPLRVRVSSTGRSATIQGELRTTTASGWVSSFPVDLALFGHGDLHNGKRPVHKVNGHLAGSSGETYFNPPSYIAPR